MGSVEERIALVEGRVEEQKQVVNVVRDAIQRLDGRLVSVEGRLVSVEGRLAGVEGRLGSLEVHIERRFDNFEQRFARIDQRLDRTNALLIALLIATIGGLGGVIAAVLQR